MQKEAEVTCDRLVNLTGRRIDLVTVRRGKEVVVALEPDKRIARVVKPWPEPDGTLTCGADTADLMKAGASYVEGLPLPRAGVVHIVREDVARHPKVRRRGDVLYPYSTTEASGGTGFVRHTALARTS